MSYILIAQMLTGIFGLLFSYVYSKTLSLQEVAQLSEYLLLTNIVLGVSNSMSDREFYASKQYNDQLNVNNRFLYDVLFSMTISTVVLSSAFQFVHADVNLLLFGLLVFYHPIQKLRINFEVNSSLAYSRFPIIFSSAITSMLLIGLYFANELSFQTLIIIRFLVLYIEMLLSCILHMPRAGLFQNKLQKFDLSYLRLTGPLIIANLFVIIYSNVDYFFVKAIFPSEDFGAYFFIFNLYTQFLIIRRVVVAYVYPKLVTLGRFDIRSKQFNTIVYSATLVCLPISFTHDFVVANHVVSLLGEKWTPYLPLFNINFVILYERLMFWFYEPYFVSRKKTYIIMLNTLISIAIMLSLFVLLYIYGASLFYIATVTLIAFIVPALITLAFDLKKDVFSIFATTLTRMLVYGAVFFYL